jgi:hypothetical protein
MHTLTDHQAADIANETLKSVILTPVCYKKCQKIIFSSAYWINN